MYQLCPSILSADFNRLGEQIQILEKQGVKWLHIDVMDGDFVKNDTTNIMREFCEYIKQITSIPLDIHLMVEDVKSYITSYLSFNPNIITFHLEACKDKNEVMDLIKYVKENNCKVGIAIKPNTSVEEIYEYLPYIHMCLIMTVEPGKGGQKLIPSTIEKIKKLNTYIVANNLELDIEADGGINVENVKKVAEAGTDIIVSGSAILNSENYKEYIKNLKNC